MTFVDAIAPNDSFIIPATDLDQALNALADGDLEALRAHLESWIECCPVCKQKDISAEE